MKTHLVGLVLWVAALPVAGCSLTSDRFSCGMFANGALVRCVDYEQVGFAFRTTVETLCRGLLGDFSTEKTCQQEGKIGGCKKESSGFTQTAWYYPESIAKTPDEVRGRCQGGEYFVDPSGARPSPADMTMTSDMTMSTGGSDMTMPSGDMSSSGDL